MLTSVAGHEARTREDESAALKALAVYREILGDAVARHDGRLVKAMGARALAQFPTAQDALYCAVEVQRALYETATGRSGPDARLRIGLHVGDVVLRDDDLFGDGVNIASRIEPLADPGGICVSGAVYDQLHGHATVRFEDLGEQTLRNLRVPVRVYRVQLPWLEPQRGEPIADRRRIAVLPFTNISPAPDDAYLADGLTEELIHTLSQLSSLRVIAPASVMRYRGTRKGATEIGQELQVGTIVEGSVRKAGQRLRITVQLIDAPTQEHLWSEAYDREMADVFAMQEEIAQCVAAEMQVQLPRGDEPAAASPRDHLEAYTAYLKGRYHLSRRSHAELDAAEKAFGDALNLDPEYALAYAGLADVYLARIDFGDLPIEDAYARGREAAERALALDGNLVEALTALAMIEAVYEQDAPEAERRLRQAIDRNPGYAPARQWYAIVLSALGRHEEALEQSRVALQLDPASPRPHVSVARAQRESGDLTGAIAEYEEALRIDPEFGIARIGLTATQHQAWAWEEAAQSAVTALERGGYEPGLRATLAELLLQVGHERDAYRNMERAIALRPHAPWLQTASAQLAFYARRFDRAIAEAEHVLREHPHNRGAYLVKALALAYSGDLDGALGTLKEAERIPGATHPEAFRAARGEILARHGHHEEAQRIRAELLASDRPRDVVRPLAALCVGIGFLEEALEHLEQAASWHVPEILWIRVDPAWDPIRDRSGFRRVLDRMNLNPPPSLPSSVLHA
jgi:adenylate cyclase